MFVRGSFYFGRRLSGKEFLFCRVYEFKDSTMCVILSISEFICFDRWMNILNKLGKEWHFEELKTCNIAILRILVTLSIEFIIKIKLILSERITYFRKHIFNFTFIFVKKKKKKETKKSKYLFICRNRVFHDALVTSRSRILTSVPSFRRKCETSCRVSFKRAPSKHD